MCCDSSERPRVTCECSGAALNRSSRTILAEPRACGFAGKPRSASTARLRLRRAAASRVASSAPVSRTMATMSRQLLDARRARSRARISSRCSARAALHGDDQRQRRLAFAQVVADVLAESRSRRLRSRARRRSAGTRCRASGRSRRRPLRSPVGAGEHRAEPRAGLEQLGGLEADHAQVVVLVERRGRACSSAAALRLRRSRWSRRPAPPCTRMSVDLHHHLEGARIEEVADQHAGGVAEQRVGGLRGRGAAPTRRRRRRAAAWRCG